MTFPADSETVREAASSFEATLEPLDDQEHEHLEGIARLEAAEEAHAEDLRLWEDEAA